VTIGACFEISNILGYRVEGESLKTSQFGVAMTVEDEFLADFTILCIVSVTMKEHRDHVE
jgi:hypothetical protein